MVVCATAHPQLISSHHVHCGNHHIRQKDLVEMSSPCDLPQRVDLDPGGMHVDEEIGDALVFGDVGIRSSDQNRPITVLGTRCPDFLTVTTKDSPSRSPRVLIPARSDPASGSENS